MNDDSRPVRFVRARDLTAGATVLTRCISPGAEHCPVTARRHDAPGAPVWHERTLLDAETHDGLTTAICVSEDGDPCDLAVDAHQPVRVWADTLPARDPRTQPQPENRPGPEL